MKLKVQVKLPTSLESMKIVDIAYFYSWVRSLSVECEAFNVLYFDALKEWRLLKIF